ncbi:Cse1-domain-containing protein [Athelia psychrophila]|uniref:Cse1-domain-containing protein n=1 Tax=Athelia psychrophila TaxID=1759441 RepID=A0A166BI94_9AGAM|nr:Cse1-domain-containing protein [Fibularhizoctonia sp. CBS 109695]
MKLLLETYYEFTCQELPPAIEDAHEEFWREREGGVVSVCKTRVLEIVQLYIKLDPNQLIKFPSVAAFISVVWALDIRTRADHSPLSTARLPDPALHVHGDVLSVSRRLEQTIEGLVEGILVLNMGLKEHEMDQFEDGPLKCIYLGLQRTTRRQATTDDVVSGARDVPWREGKGGDGSTAKDSVTYLLTVVATRRGTTQYGVTSTNSLVDIAEYFLDHLRGLAGGSGDGWPVLQVDAIGYLYNFRSQLTKYQLLSVLPLLVRHLGLANDVCYTSDQPGALHQEAPASAIHDRWSLFGKRAEEVARLGFLNYALVCS